jgi:hypothetical protein
MRRAWGNDFASRTPNRNHQHRCNDPQQAHADSQSDGKEDVERHLEVQRPARDENGLVTGPGQHEVGGDDVPRRPDRVDSKRWNGEDGDDLDRGDEPVERKYALDAAGKKGACRMPGGEQRSRGEGHDEAADDEEDVDAGGSVDPVVAQTVALDQQDGGVMQYHHERGDGAQDLHKAIGRPRRRAVLQMLQAGLLRHIWSVLVCDSL